MGLTLLQHEATVQAHANFYSAVAFRGSGRYLRFNCRTLAEAISKGSAMYVDRPVAIYAVRGANQSHIVNVTRTGDRSMEVKLYHVVQFGPEGVTHTDYATRTEAEAFMAELQAQAANGVLPEGTSAYHVDGPGELEDKLSMAELVALHNLLRPEKPVKSFHDLGTGAPRVWNLMNAHLHPAAPKVEAAPIDTEPKEAEMATKKTTAKRAKKEKATTNGTGHRGRAPAFADDAKITVLADENPKRKGTAAHKQFEMYRSGMLVGTAVEKGVPRASLNYDVAHKYISIG